MESSFQLPGGSTTTGATTLAETLLEDLDDLSDNDDANDDGDDPYHEHQDQDEEDLGENKASFAAAITQDGMAFGVTSFLPNTSSSRSNSKKRRLLENPSLLKHLQNIQHYLDNRHDQEGSSKQDNNDNDDHDDNHNNSATTTSTISSWVLQSNQHLAAVVNELQDVHADLRVAYRPKFPELEELIPNLLQFKHVVATIGNDPDVAHAVMERLQPNHHNNNNKNNTAMPPSYNASQEPYSQQQQPQVILSNNQIITLSVAASTTMGRMLTDEEYHRVKLELQYMDQLFHVQQTLTNFVQERMQFVAPTMCALLGSTTLVAQLMGLAGGSLSDLAKIPACNLQVMGKKQQQLAMIQQQQQQPISITATAASTSHMGCLAQCDLVMTLCPKPLQKKALKVVAAKLALAIRMDHVAQSTTMPTAAARAAATRQGLAFRQDILQKIQAWQEPQKAMVIKALPKPDLTIKKRRGGKRMRRIKERFEETNMMKQANTRSFSGPTGEYGDDAMGLTLGLLDGGGDASAIGAEGATNASGALRKHAVEKRKLRQANTKASRKRAAQLSSQAASAGSAGSSGLASSMVFTPVQGMELVDPDANRDRVREANRKWFTEHGGFQSALPQSSLLSKKK